MLGRGEGEAPELTLRIGLPPDFEGGETETYASFTDDPEQAGLPTLVGGTDGCAWLSWDGGVVRGSTWSQRDGFGPLLQLDAPEGVRAVQVGEDWLLLALEDGVLSTTPLRSSEGAR